MREVFVLCSRTHKMSPVPRVTRGCPGSPHFDTMRETPRSRPRAGLFTSNIDTQKLGVARLLNFVAIYIIMHPFFFLKRNKKFRPFFPPFFPPRFRSDYKLFHGNAWGTVWCEKRKENGDVYISVALEIYVLSMIRMFFCFFNIQICSSFQKQKGSYFLLLQNSNIFHTTVKTYVNSSLNGQNDGTV